MSAKSIKIAATLLCVCPASLLAQETSIEKWGLNLGVFLTDQDMITEFNASFMGGSFEVDFEDDLGLDESQTVFRFGAFRNFNDRHRLDFDIFDLSQTAVATLSREVEWGDTTFPISAEVATNFDLIIYKIGYTYQALRKENYTLGITGGLYVADVALKLRGVLISEEEVGDITAPLPVIGLRWEYLMSDRWRMSASAELFAVSIEEYDGSLRDILVGIDYQLFDHAAIGLGYNSVQLTVDAAEERINADLDWDYSGVIGYLKFRF